MGVLGAQGFAGLELLTEALPQHTDDRGNAFLVAKAGAGVFQTHLIYSHRSR